MQPVFADFDASILRFRANVQMRLRHHTSWIYLFGKDLIQNLHDFIQAARSSDTKFDGNLTTITSTPRVRTGIHFAHEVIDLINRFYLNQRLLTFSYAEFHASITAISITLLESITHPGIRAFNRVIAGM